MNHQLFQLITIHLKELYREPGVIFWGIVFPVLMAWGIGVAFTGQGNIVRKVAVLENQTDKNSVLQHFLANDAIRLSVSKDEDKIVQYEKIIPNKKFGDTKYIFLSTTWEKAIILLKRGTVAVIVESYNNDFRYHFDPTNPEAQLVQLQLTALINGQTELFNDDKIQPLTNIGMRYIDFLVPGLIAMGIMMSSMWSISYSVIEKRMKKLLRRMVATPMKKSYFLASILIARIFLNCIESILLFLFSYFYFDISVEGSFWGLMIIFLSGNIAFAGIAILVASRTANTEVGNGLINAVVTPMMIFSGIFFSYHNFPDWIIVIIQKLPLTMLADGMRSIFIEGADVVRIISKSLALSGLGVVTFLIGLKFYKWY